VNVTARSGTWTGDTTTSQVLATTPGITLYTAADPGFHDAAEIANLDVVAHPLAVAECADAAAVASAVAASPRLPLTIRGGGWSPAGLSTVDGGIVLSTRHLRSRDALLVRTLPPHPGIPARYHGRVGIAVSAVSTSTADAVAPLLALDGLPHSERTHTRPADSHPAFSLGRRLRRGSHATAKRQNRIRPGRPVPPVRNHSGGAPCLSPPTPDPTS